MIYITDVLSMFSNGKVNQDASDVLGRLKEDDRVVLLSDTGELVVNADILSLLTKANGQISIEKCTSDYQVVFVLGKYIGRGDSVRLSLKNTELIKSLDFLKGSDTVLFGWKNASKKKTATAKKPRASKKSKDALLASEDDSFMKFEEMSKEKEAVSEKPKKERAKKNASSSDFLDLPVESVLGMDGEHFHRVNIYKVKDIYTYNQSGKRWSEFLTRDGYDAMVAKLKAFGQPALKEYR